HYLGGNQPLYGLRYPNIEESITIELLARHYLHEIQQKHPNGPYHLFGYCFGGAIAYEMAQRLLVEGNDVASLTIVNFTNPAHQTIHVRNELNVQQVRKQNMKKLLTMPWKEKTSFLKEKVTNLIALPQARAEMESTID